MYQVCASLSSKLPMYQWQAGLFSFVSVKHRLTETYESTLVVLDYIPFFSSVIRKKRDTPESNYSTQ